ncbi:MAG TPA: FAD-dependent oxidoreductase [Longimicrobiales bacterium]|nr:FAD-dependent oxidoreductase [Longimicrobiales bacterium]
MSSSSELSGPDLRAGVALSDVPMGGMLLGHADGEAVLLFRRDREILALSATCTHYGGPLAEGLVVGDTLRCPWHHGCFDLRTGETIGPPALSDVAAWWVEVRDDRAFVTGRKAPAAHEPVAGPESVVIVGAGAAGQCAAETLRRAGYTGPVTLVDTGLDLPYDKPNLSKDYLAGAAEEAWIPLRPSEFYAEHGIDLKLGRRVVAIDSAARSVRLDDGAVLRFGALLLATGSSPIRLPTELVRGRVHYLRTFADSKAIIAASQSAQRAVILGASFIGLEVAASLRARGLEVHVAAPEAIPLERVLGKELGGFVRELHEQHGVHFHLGRTAKQVAAGSVTLDNGEVLAADLVVAGIGVRPVTELAESAGLQVDRGILVDEFLETSVPGIYAAGDLARWPYAATGEQIRVEHWVVAQRQGRAAAFNILGRRQPFSAVPFFWSAHYDVVIAYVGHASSWDRIEIDGDIAARDCTVRYLRADQLLAAATIFRDRESLEIEAEMEKRLQAMVLA